MDRVPLHYRTLVEHQTFVRLCENRDWLAANFGRRITLEEAAAATGSA